jgi:hypothetical protein
MLHVTKNNILAEYKARDIELKDFNIFGIRNVEDMDKGIWNDYIGYFTEYDFKIYNGTTDPGVYYTKNRMNSKGCAHLVLGYHEDIWLIDLHRGKYDAMCNRYPTKPVKVWRDNNEDFENNEWIEEVGHFGINLHRASRLKIMDRIWKYSAGCQVIQDPNDFDEFMFVAKASEMKFFSYLLLENKFYY